MTRRTRVTLGAALAALVLLFGGRWVALRYTEHAWYANLGLGALYWKLLLRESLWRAGVFAVALGWYAANTLAVGRSIGAIHLPRRVGNLEIAEAVPRHWLRGVALAIAAILALATVYSFSDIDHYAALYRHAVPLGAVEPVLGKDAAFYLARLPLLEVLQLAALLSALLALALVAGLYLLTGSLTISRRQVRVTPHARTHIVAGLAVLALVLAWGFQLHAYQIVGGGGHFDGVLSAVDHAIRLPAANALALVALAVCIGTAMSLRKARAPLVFFLWATLLIATLLGRYVVPAVADAWGSSGRAGADQIDEAWVRSGMGLDAAAVLLIRRASEPAAGDWAQIGATVSGFSPWSTAPGALDALMPLAAGDSGLRREWTTSTLSLPAAKPGAPGPPRLIALAVAQTDPFEAARATPRPGWRALHEGPAAWGGPWYAVDASARAGPPRFFTSLAPTDTGTLTARPLYGVDSLVRFPPRPADLAVVVAPKAGPAAADDSLPGVPLGGFFRRLMFAWALQSPPLLGRGVQPRDHLLFWRDVPGRLGRLYSFATFDTPRAVVEGGRVLWVSDGLVDSPRYPLAPHLTWRGDDVSYLAAPYVATVDAGSGATRIYLRPRATPFAASVAQAEGVTPLPADSLPPQVAAQLGYPAALIGPEAATFARLEHDSLGARLPWSIAWSDSAWHGDAGQLAPALAVLDLGGGPRLWSLVPLMDQAGTHLTGIVAGSADTLGQPEVRLVALPPGLPTPAAIRARLSSLPGAQAIASLAQGDMGAPAQDGDVVPLYAAGTIVYAGGVFAVERRGEPPRLQLIGVAAGTHAGLGVDAADAARAAQRGDVGTADIPGGALAAARAAFQTLDSAVRSADWAQVGRAYARLKRALGLGLEREP